MKTLDEILDTPVKYKPEFTYLEKCHESYHGVNRNLLTNNDISEAIRSAAGIDEYEIRRLDNEWLNNGL